MISTPTHYPTSRYQYEKTIYCEFLTDYDVPYLIQFVDSSDYLNHNGLILSEMIFDKQDYSIPSPNDPKVFATIINEANWMINNNSMIACICSNKDKLSACRHRLFRSHLKRSRGVIAYDVVVNVVGGFQDYVFVFFKHGNGVYENYVDKNLSSLLSDLVKRDNRKNISISMI